MKVGIPSEIKNREYRVALTPAGVHQLVRSGHEVLVAGRGRAPAPRSPTSSTPPPARTSSPTPRRSGGAPTSSARSRSRSASEYGYLRDDLVLFTYLHLAADRPTTDALLAAGTTSIAYETVQLARRLPAAAGADERGRRAAGHPGRRLPPDAERGRLGRAARRACPGVDAAKVVVLGGGRGRPARRARSPSACAPTSRCSTCRCRGCATSTPRSAAACARSPRARTRSSASSLDADVVIGAVLVPGARAPRLVTDELVARMRPGSVLVDVAVDQGGCFEDTRPTTHDDPTFRVHESRLLLRRQHARRRPRHVDPRPDQRHAAVPDARSRTAAGAAAVGRRPRARRRADHARGPARTTPRSAQAHGVPRPDRRATRGRAAPSRRVMATALVIGGSGQIGRAAVPALLADGWDVRVLRAGTRRDVGGAPGRSWATGTTPRRSTAALGGGVDVLVDVVALRRPARRRAARPRATGSGRPSSSPAPAVYVDDGGRRLRDRRASARFPVPVDEDQPTVAAGPRLVRDRQGRARAGVGAARRCPTTILRPGAIHGPGLRPAARVDVRQARARRARRAGARLRRREPVPHRRRPAVLGELVRLAAAQPGAPGAQRGRPAGADGRRDRHARSTPSMGVDVAATSRLPGAPGGRRRAHPVDGAAPGRPRHGRAADRARLRRARTRTRTPSGAVRRVARRRRVGADWREAFPGFARMEAMGDFFDYAAEDAFLAPAGVTGAGVRLSAMMSAMQPTDARRRQPLRRSRPPSPYGLPDYTPDPRGALPPGAARRHGRSSARRSRRSRPTPRRRRVENTLEALERSGPPAAPGGRRRSTTSRARTRRPASRRSRRRSRRCSRRTTTRSTSTRGCSPASRRCRPTWTPARSSSSPTPRGCCTARTRRSSARACGLDEASQDRLRALNAEITTPRDDVRPRPAGGARTRPACWSPTRTSSTGCPRTPAPPPRRRRATAGTSDGWFLELALPTQQAPLSVAARPRRCASACSGRRPAAARRRPHDTRADRARPGPQARRARPAARVSAPRRVRRGGRDREDGRGGGRHPRAARARGRRERPRRGRATWPRRSSATTRAPRLEPWDWAFYAEQVKKERRSLDDALPAAVPRAGARAGRRRVPRGQRAVRPHVRRAPRPRGLPPRRARLRGVRRATAAGSACSSPTTGRASPSAAAPG